MPRPGPYATSRHIPRIRAKRLFAFLLIAAGTVAGARSASATAISLGSSANYGILTGQSETLSLKGNFNLTGNLGVGANSGITFQHSGNKISGTEYKDTGVTSSGSATIGSVVTQSMTSAIADAQAASNAAAALAGTSGLIDQGGSINVTNSSSSITIKALTNLSENVLNISSLSLANGSITFDDNGFTGAKFIINITGGFSVSSSAMIQASNGASADDILFNVEGTGSAVSITGNSTNAIVGTILAPQRNVSLSGGGSLTGAIMAGLKGSSSTPYSLTSANSGFNLTALTYTPSTASTNVPEAPSLVLYGAGLAALAAARRARKIRS